MIPFAVGYSREVSPYAYDESGRRVQTPSKGQLRERAILDEAEKQLSALGPDAMTMETIATAVGLTRAALYFYFRSKNDVLAALVKRTTVELTGAVTTRRVAVPDSSAGALRSAIDLTRDLWTRHGAVMKAAIDLSASVPSIAALWDDARETIVDSVRLLVEDAPTFGDASADDDEALVRVLVAMTERAFYDATRRGASLTDTQRVVTLIWARSLGIE